MEGENEEEVCRLDSVGEFYLITGSMKDKAGKVKGQERACVTEGGVYILFARPASCHLGFLEHWINWDHVPVRVEQPNQA